MRREKKSTLSPKERHARKLRASKVNVITNLILPPLKLTVGILGNSSALIADAINSIGDVITYATMHLFLKISGKPKDRDHKYGHGMYEVIATFALAAMMVVVAALIMAKSAKTLYLYFSEEVLPEIPSWSVVGVAIFTIVVKVALYYYTRREAQATKSDGLMAQAMDHKSDTFTASAVVIGAGGAILIGGMGALLEPIAAFIVALAIIRMGVSLLYPSFQKLTDSSLPEQDEEKVKSLALSVPGVHDPHNLKTRMLGSDRAAFELDICVNEDLSVRDGHQLADQVEQAIRSEFGENAHVIVHVEPLGSASVDAG
ncbi:MAG: cation diffusion facilitator family transporter [Porphyromonas sp.]|nr:cation diffusion facilitator family transporter [Porphyromonas sp.]